MNIAAREFLIDIIKQQTTLSLKANQPEEEIQEETSVSEKGRAAKDFIENSDFDDDGKQTLANLSSLFLNESITLDEEKDPKSLCVYFLALLVSRENHTYNINIEDQKGEEIEKETSVLKFCYDIRDLYGVGNYDNQNDFFWGGMTKNGQIDSCFKDSDVTVENFRFATNDEIVSFVDQLPESALNFWFNHILAAMNLSLRS